MRNTKIELLLFAVSLAFFVGCGSLPRLPHLPGQSARTNDVQPDNTTSASGVTVRELKNPPRIPATQAAKSSPVASAVSSIVHWMELAGALCLLAAAILIYLGQIIPGVKCAVAAVALPVSAVWFNYHYGLVIGMILISAAVGFLWAFYKKNPALLSAAETEFSSLETRLFDEIKKLRGQLNLPSSSPVANIESAAK